jgi:hypothetical protein
VIAYQEGGGERMVAFGKVRKIEDNKSHAQILLGGGVTEGDQVVEKAAFGININPYGGLVPLTIETGDDDYDTDGSTIWAGLIVEYNIAQFTNISELYPVIEVGLVGVPEGSAYNANIGIMKKFYFRNIAVFGVAKYGMIEITYSDFGVDEEKVELWGVGLEVGAEFMFHPNAAIQARMGYAAFAETEIADIPGTSAEAAGLTFRAGVMFTL